MITGRPKAELVLSEDERAQLQAFARSSLEQLGQRHLDNLLTSLCAAILLTNGTTPPGSANSRLSSAC